MLLVAIVIAAANALGASDQDDLLFRTTVVRDWTGDGAADTATITVRGLRLEEAIATLTVRSSGGPIMADSWPTSNYLLVSDIKDSVERRAYVRRQLEHALTAHRLPDDYPTCPGVDEAQCDELKASSQFALGINRGYENVEVVAWSKKRLAFVAIEACCD